MTRVAPATLLALAAAAGCMGAEDPCARATASAVLVPKGEPGEPLRVRGVVFILHGVAPCGVRPPSRPS